MPRVLPSDAKALVGRAFIEYRADGYNCIYPYGCGFSSDTLLAICVHDIRLAVPVGHAWLHKEGVETLLKWKGAMLFR